MKIYICKKCKFKTREKNKLCPICKSEMKQEEGTISYNPNLPNVLKDNINTNDKKDAVKIYYYCPKENKKMKTRICLDCNNVGYLCIEYNEKQAYINRIDSLYDVYENDEVEVIANNLKEEEKYWLYHNFSSSYSFFYRRDKVKSIACILMGLIMFGLCFLLGADYIVKEMAFVSYIALGIGFGCLFVFTSLGIWYLIDASNVEYKGVQVPILIISLISMILFIITSIMFNLMFIGQLIFGLIYSLIASFSYLIYLYVKRKKK